MGKKKRAIPIYIHEEKNIEEEDDLPLSGKVTRDDRIETKKSLENTSPCSLDILPSGMSSKRREGGLSRSRKRMGNFTFDDHLEKIWNDLSGDRKSSFALLDSMCFIFYKTGRVSGLDRIKRKGIFSKKNHWRLVIFCHFGECVNSETRTRCILVLDSMEMGAREIEPDLRKFVFDIFKAEVRPEIKDNIDRIPILVPKVPQQRNSVDCGRFVLYFIQNFMDAAPENFSLLNVNGYPYFMKPSWFTSDEFEDFCDNLEKESTFHPPLTPVVGRFSQRIRNRALEQPPPPKIGKKLAVSQESSKADVEVIFIE